LKHVVLISLLCSVSLPAYSQNCPAGRPAIYFGNGINNTYQDALFSGFQLQEAVKSQVTQANSVDAACLDFKLAYDSKFLNSQNQVISAFNSLLQIGISSGAQVTQQFLSQLWLWYSNGTIAPAWFQQTTASIIIGGTVVVQGDLQNQVSSYIDDQTSGNKSIVVAHSQGNLYANQAYSVLFPVPSPNDSSKFSIIGVATPADAVAGGGSYITLDNDIILLVPGRLKSNTSNNPAPGAPCSFPLDLNGLASNPLQTVNSSLACHSFDNSYLPGQISGSLIISDVISAIPIVLGVSKLGPGTGTITSNPTGIDCGSVCVSAFPNGKTVTLTATADPGSTFMGWSGNCAALATGGITNQPTITFPVFYDAAGTEVTSYPENCTVTFVSANAAVRLNPFGNQAGAGPYNVEVVDHSLTLTPAPEDITVTLLREVISQCSGLLFSSNRIVVVPQGQSSASYNFNAGRDPACNALPITTQYTVTQAVLGTNTVLDLSGIPAQQFVLTVTR